jgi:hypothetical protein
VVNIYEIEWNDHFFDNTKDKNIADTNNTTDNTTKITPEEAEK